MNFKYFKRVKEGFKFGSEESIFVHCFESIGGVDSEFSFFLGEKFKMVESGLLDENFFMTKEDVIFVKLFF